MKAFLLAAHPVGSVYMSLDPTSPADLFGGTWEELTGVYLRARDDAHAAGSRFGSDTHTHDAGDIMASISWAVGGGGGISFEGTDSKTVHTNNTKLTGNVTSDESMNARGIRTKGTSAGASTLPASVSVYCWRRTA